MSQGLLICLMNRSSGLMNNIILGNDKRIIRQRTIPLSYWRYNLKVSFLFWRKRIIKFIIAFRLKVWYNNI